MNKDKKLQETSERLDPFTTEGDESALDDALTAAFDLEKIHQTVKRRKWFKRMSLAVLLIAAMGYGWALQSYGGKYLAFVQSQKKEAVKTQDYLAQTQAVATFKRYPNTVSEYSYYYNGQAKDRYFMEKITKIFPTGAEKLFLVNSYDESLGAKAAGMSKSQTVTTLENGFPEKQATRIREYTAAGLNETDNGQTASFYHPDYPVPEGQQPSTVLQNLESAAQIELAVSFNKGYSLAEVNQFLKDFGQPTFYWLDAYTAADEGFLNKGISEVYGFSSCKQENTSNTAATSPIFEDEEAYIAALEESTVTFIPGGSLLFGDNENNQIDGQKISEIIDVSQILRKKLQQKQGSVIGVTLIGSSETFQQLAKCPEVRALSVGTVIPN